MLLDIIMLEEKMVLKSLTEMWGKLGFNVKKSQY